MWCWTRFYVSLAVGTRAYWITKRSTTRLAEFTNSKPDWRDNKNTKQSREQTDSLRDGQCRIRQCGIWSPQKIRSCATMLLNNDEQCSWLTLIVGVSYVVIIHGEGSQDYYDAIVSVRIWEATSSRSSLTLRLLFDFSCLLSFFIGQ